MPKKNDYTLREDQVEQVRLAMKSSRASVVKRATVLYNLHQGYSVREVAEMHQVSRPTVYNYVARFQAEGLGGLPDRPIPGRPRKATPAYIELLHETLESDPQDKGFAFTIWTQARLRTYLADQTGISLSRSRFQELMQRLGYVYRRPKYSVSHQQDAELRQQVSDALEELKKEPRQKPANYSLWTKP
jgi:transposase